MKENILNKLKQEHREVIATLKKISITKDLDRKKLLFQEVYDALQAHMIGEEETLYAHLKKDTHELTAEEVAREAESEHLEIKEILSRLKKLDVDSISFDEELKSLESVVGDHILEEESDLFTEAKDDFSAAELQDFAVEYEEAKSHLH